MSEFGLPPDGSKQHTVEMEVEGGAINVYLDGHPIHGLKGINIVAGPDDAFPLVTLEFMAKAVTVDDAKIDTITASKPPPWKPSRAIPPASGGGYTLAGGGGGAGGGVASPPPAEGTSGAGGSKLRMSEDTERALEAMRREAIPNPFDGGPYSPSFEYREVTCTHCGGSGIKMPPDRKVLGEPCRACQGRGKMTVTV